MHRFLRWPCLGVMLVLALALASCKPQPEPVAKAAPSAPATTITALIWAPDWPQEMLQVATEFSRENPDVRVNVQFMIGNSVEENIKPKVAARNLPDLMSVNPNAYSAALADQGVLADIGHTTAWANLLPKLKSDWISPQGKRFGIGGGIAATLMYYNRDMFAKAGIKTPPATFDEFLDVCARLKKAGFTPIMWNGGFPNMLGNGPFAFGFANNIVAHTPDWKKRIADGTLKLDNADGADLFARIKLVADRGYVQPDYMDTTYDDGIKLFTEGKVAMAFHGTWASGMLMNGKGFTTGVFLPPWNAPGKPTVPVIGSETGFAVCDTAHKEAATRFLEFIMGKGFAIQQNKRQNISPLKAAPGALAGEPRIVAYIDSISAAPVTGSPYYSMLPANTIDMLHPLIQHVLLGQVTPQQAARELEASIRNEARKNYK